MLSALAIFLVTLLLIIRQPRGLSVGTSAVGGALAALALGVVHIEDVRTVAGIVWDATLAFIGIVLLSLVLDAIGFFEWAALHMVRLSRGSGIGLFVNMLLLGAAVSVLFANDGAALILTPVVLAKMRRLKLSASAMFAFVIAGGFIGDSASNMLVISNLTNIVTADYFHIGFWEYARHMWLPNILSIVASIAVLTALFYRSIPRRIDRVALPSPKEAIKDPVMFRLSWLFLVLLTAGYFIGDSYGLPTSLFALGGALLFLALASLRGAVRPYETVKAAPWHVVWFSIGLYVVVYGLKNAGLTRDVAYLLASLHTYGENTAIIGTGFTAALLSAVMNNMPTVMVMDIAIDHLGAAAHDSLVYANILGCNIGPKLTPVGSLATLLWLHVLERHGVKIGWKAYMKIGFLVTPPVLLAALTGVL